MDQSTYPSFTLVFIVIALVIIFAFAIYSIRKVRRNKLQLKLRLEKAEQVKRDEVVDRRLHAAEDEPILKWLEGFEDIPKDDLERLSSYPDLPKHFREKWGDAVDDAKRDIEDARLTLTSQAEEQQRVDQANKALIAIMNESDEVAQFTALYMFIEESGLMPNVDEEHSDWAFGRIEMQEEQMQKLLLERAQAGDQQSFKVLFEIANDKWDDHEYPSDWDELVAKMVKNPSSYHFGEQFETLRQEMDRGGLRLLASEALSEKSLLKAKYVLAIVNKVNNSRYSWRDEVGEVRLAQLADMVNEAWNAQ
jgi:hypothetical protein